jgi:L-lysine 6-oxidase
MRMGSYYAIQPTVGVARVGNSPDEFYLAPETIGGLPLACDAQGNAILAGGTPEPVRAFKDPHGRIKRQAASFKVVRFDDARPDDPGIEVILTGEDVAAFEWTVHIASKKAAWYNFAELEGNLLLGPDNSYEQRQVPLRNAGVTGDDARQKLIIDPGPHTLNAPKSAAEFSRRNPPPGYTHFSFPPPPTQGYAIDLLGEMLTDDEGRLRVLGGYGRAGGEQSIDSFAGADTWHDDISDGAVTCQVTFKDGQRVTLSAWIIVGSPKFAPELVNIVSLDDTMFDVGVRYLNLIPDLYVRAKSPGWNPDYTANFQRDIEPIIRRPADYQWVANVQAMQAFTAPPFDPRDASEANRQNRENYFSYFRKVSDENTLFRGANAIPMMPLQSGTNSVSNTLIDKFFTLTETQYFLVGQWAAGKFTTDAPPPLRGVTDADRAGVGNCVGWPMCPGIEVTWSLYNPAIYAQTYQIKHAHDAQYYFAHGLSPSIDETAGTQGCEPGDLTKRMAIPWQADFFQCTAQFINYTDDTVNKANGIPLPPTYYGYWWPPQSPMYVLTGDLDAQTQTITGLPAGLQVYYPRGINSFAQMIMAWSYLGFIVNQNQGPDGRSYPYFVERERNNNRFVSTSVAVGSVDNFVNAEDVVFWPLYFLKNDQETTTDHQLVTRLQAAAEPVKYGTTPAADRITAPPRGPRRHGRSG